MLSSPRVKNILIYEIRNSCSLRGVRSPRGGAYRGRHERGRLDAVGAAGRSVIVHADERPAVHGEIAWSWRPDAGVKPVPLPT
ncbi:hypothetical protein, partial [Bradyrhizobium sp. STM 3809]|uniref:hypothetical protein n=1 Tax=Bradyrhizobium sp. STM 3809 TaxID=551936 RepID=UPI001AEC4290